MSERTISLASKFSPPTPIGVQAPRKRLLAELDSNATRALITIRAAAGSGKTTLLGQWVQRHKERRFAWLSVQAEDDDASGFFRSFVASIRAQVPEFTVCTPSKFDPEVSLSTESWISAIKGALGDISDEVWIILDDIHHIRSSKILSVLEQVLISSPRCVHFILAGRSLPAFVDGPIALHHRVQRFESDDLALLPVEIEELYFLYCKEPASSEVAENLYRQTDGWIAIVRLLLAHMYSRPSGVELNFAGQGVGTEAYNYLSYTVFDPLPEKLKRSLLAISVPEEVSAGLCQKLGDVANGSELLDDLRRWGVFLSERFENDKRGQSKWFRLHPLFRDFLLFRLRDGSGVDEEEINRQVSLWAAESGRVEQAVHYALRLADKSLAADLIEEHWDYFLGYGKIELVIGWSAQFPDHYFRERHYLTVTCIWMLATGREALRAHHLFQESEVLRKQAKDAFDEGDTARWIHWLTLEVLYSAAVLDDAGAVFAAVHRFQSVIDLAPSLYRGVVTIVEGYSKLLSGMFDAARTTSHTGSSLTVAEHPYGAKLSDVIAVFADRYQGRFESALERAEIIQNESLPVFGEDGPWAALEAIKGGVYYEQNRLDEVQKHASSPMPYLRFTFIEGIVEAYRTNIRIYAADERFAEAMSLVEMLESLGHRGAFQRLLVHAEHEKVWLKIASASGDVEDYAQQIGLESTATEFLGRKRKFYNESIVFRCLAWSRVLHHLKRDRDAIELLSTLVGITSEVGRVDLEIECRTLRGICAHRSARPELAIEDLSAVIRVGYRGPHIRSVVDCGEGVLKWLEDFSNQAALPEDKHRASIYLEQLIETAKGDWRRSQKAFGGDRPDMLTDRESELLGYLANGLSNQEIENITDMKITTIKWHLRNLYSKLNVRRRGHAVAVGRRMGLISQTGAS